MGISAGIALFHISPTAGDVWVDGECALATFCSDQVLFAKLTLCFSLPVWLADCLCFGVFGHCASIQSSRKLVESDWRGYNRNHSSEHRKSDTNISSWSVFAMTDSPTFSFCDVLSRLLISLNIFLLLLLLVFLVLQQRRRASGRSILFASCRPSHCW